MGEYLMVKNWHKYQLALKSGRSYRKWIRIDTNRVDDAEFAALTLFERAVLTGIMEYSGRSGRWVDNDLQFIGMALNALPSERHLIRRAVGKLMVRDLQDAPIPPVSHYQDTLKMVVRGFLFLCNQQNIEEKGSEHNITGHNITEQKNKTLVPPRKKPTPAEPIFWQGQILKVTGKVHKALTEAFPKIDPTEQYKRADGWLVGNPARRRSNHGRFLNNWFSKAQERMDFAEIRRKNNGTGDYHEKQENRRRELLERALHGD